jgi:hypothetical protein
VTLTPQKPFSQPCRGAPELGSTARNQIEVEELVTDLKPVSFAFLDVYRGTGGLLDTRANEACPQDATAHAENPFDR